MFPRTDVYLDPIYDWETNLPKTEKNNEINKFLSSKPQQLGPDDSENINKYLENNKEALNYFIIGTAQPHYWFKISPNEKQLIKARMPHLHPIRRITDALLWRCQIKLDNNDPNSVFTDLQAAMKCGAHLFGNGFMIEQLVGMAILNNSEEALLGWMAQNKFPPEMISDIEKTLTALFSQSYPFVNLGLERTAFKDLIQYCFTTGGPGGGHLLPKQYQFLLKLDQREPIDEWFPNKLEWPKAAEAIFISSMHAGRDETLQKGMEYYDLLEVEEHQSPWQRHGHSVPEDTFTTGSSIHLTLSK